MIEIKVSGSHRRKVINSLKKDISQKSDHKNFYFYRLNSLPIRSRRKSHFSGQYSQSIKNQSSPNNREGAKRAHCVGPISNANPANRNINNLLIRRNRKMANCLTEDSHIRQNLNLNDANLEKGRSFLDLKTHFNTLEPRVTEQKLQDLGRDRKLPKVSENANSINDLTSGSKSVFKKSKTEEKRESPEAKKRLVSKSDDYFFVRSINEYILKLSNPGRNKTESKKSHKFNSIGFEGQSKAEVLRRKNKNKQEEQNFKTIESPNQGYQNSYLCLESSCLQEQQSVAGIVHYATLIRNQNAKGGNSFRKNQSKCYHSRTKTVSSNSHTSLLNERTGSVDQTRRSREAVAQAASKIQRHPKRGTSESSIDIKQDEIQIQKKTDFRFSLKKKLSFSIRNTLLSRVNENLLKDAADKAKRFIDHKKTLENKYSASSEAEIEEARQKYKNSLTPW